jgi:hypothetical protein
MKTKLASLIRTFASRRMVVAVLSCLMTVSLVADQSSPRCIWKALENSGDSKSEENDGPEKETLTQSTVRMRQLVLGKQRQGRYLMDIGYGRPFLLLPKSSTERSSSPFGRRFSSANGLSLPLRC